VGGGGVELMYSIIGQPLKVAGVGEGGGGL
jgi:hypothetical protein